MIPFRFRLISRIDLIPFRSCGAGGNHAAPALTQTLHLPGDEEITHEDAGQLGPGAPDAPPRVRKHSAPRVPVQSLLLDEDPCLCLESSVPIPIRASGMLQKQEVCEDPVSDFL